MSEEVREWYDTTTYGEIKNIIRDRMSVMAREYVGIGFYLRRVRDNEMYLEDGYASIYEFAMTEFGMSKSTVNHCMRVNEQFSVGGNAPMIDNRYKDFSKSQLQEMLYLPEDKWNDVTPDMTVKEIRDMKDDRLDVEPGEQIPGQMTIEDYPEYMPEEKEKCNKYDGYSCSIREVIRKHFTKKGNVEECAGCCGICVKKGECEYTCEAVKGQMEDTKEVNSETEFDEKVSEELAMRNQTNSFPFDQDIGDDEPDNEVDSDIDNVVDADYLNVDDSHNKAGYSALEEEADQFETSSNWTKKVTPQSLLAEEQEKLNQWLEAFKGDKNLPVFIEKQKIIVAALAGMVTDLEEINQPEPVQPELPIMKNNEQRKEWLRDYKSWGLWYEDTHIGARFYKYEFDNKAILIAEEYTTPATDYCPEHESCYLHLVGGPEPKKHKRYGFNTWPYHERYNKHPDSETELVGFLKEVQKK